MRICREAGGVATNRFERDLDIGVPVNDGRRLEVVVDGLPLHGGAQLAWTPRSSQCCTVMGHRMEAQLMRMGGS